MLGHWGLSVWAKEGRASRAIPLLLGVGATIIMFLPASNLFFVVGTHVGERLL